MQAFKCSFLIVAKTATLSAKMTEDEMNSHGNI